jgi:hypothetical protein
MLTIWKVIPHNVEDSYRLFMTGLTMACVRSIMMCLACGVAAVAQAQQHHHHHHHQGGYNYGTSQGQPTYGSSGGGGWAGNPYPNSPVVSGVRTPYPQVAISGYRGHRQHYHDGGVYQTPVYQTPVYQTPVFQTPVYQTPVYVNTGPAYWAPLAPVVVAPVISVMPVVQPTLPDPAEDSSKRPVKPSTPAARLRSLEHQANGDEQLRKQLWAQAYMRYRSAIEAAGDRGEAQFRQGFTHTVMQHYAPAIREFKRGLYLDRDLPLNGIRLAMLFGPGSEALRTSVLHKVADWVKEDSKDADRLFLLGLLLHYEDDPRSREVLKAAQRVSTDSTDHIVALLAAQDQQPPPVGKPGLLLELPPLPDAGFQQAPAPQLPNPPLPLLPPLNPVAEPVPGGLPVLSNRPTPPFIVVASDKRLGP